MQIICGAPTTLAVKGLMMVMMMTGKRELPRKDELTGAELKLSNLDP